MRSEKYYITATNIRINDPGLESAVFIMESVDMAASPRPLIRIFLQGLCLYCLLFAVTPAFADDKATAVVENLHGILLENMQQADSRGYAGRYQALAGYIEENFDLPLICKVILSRYWSKFSETERQRFTDLFTRLTIATYASRFSEYQDEQFHTLSVEPLKKGRLLVKTEIRSAQEDPVSLDYLMHRQDDRWLIISVVANGINDLSLKRAEYGTIRKDEGFASLLGQIEDKIRQYETP